MRRGLRSGVRRGLRGGVRSALVALTSVLVVGLCPSPAGADHQPGHLYAMSWYVREGTSGVRQWRPDQPITSSQCVFQAQWVNITIEQPQPLNWVEIGTSAGSNCAGEGVPGWEGEWTWYAAYYNAVTGWHVINFQPIGPGPYHDFQLFAYQGWYYMYVDQTQIGAVNWPITGKEAAVGYETYDAAAAMPWYSGYSLKQTNTGGPWQNWTAKYEPPPLQYPHLGVCGYFVNATEFRATQTPGNPNCD